MAVNPSEDNLYAITVNWNKPEDTCECLSTLINQVGLCVNIILVDNGSTDHSLEHIQGKFPQVQSIRSERNLGFAGGFNLGIKEALKQGADYILIINNDTHAAPTMCKSLLSVMGEENLGLAAPIIYYAQKPQEIWSSGGYIHPFLLEPIDSHRRDRDFIENTTTRTFLSGCCILIKKQVFLTVGLFDENFFLYYEDLDFCLRILRTNWKMVVVPSAELWHKVSLSSGGERSSKERYFMACSSGYYFRKHMNIRNFLFILLYRFGSTIKWTFFMAKKKDWTTLNAYWHGLFDGWILKNCSTQKIN